MLPQNLSEMKIQQTQYIDNQWNDIFIPGFDISSRDRVADNDNSAGVACDS